MLRTPAETQNWKVVKETKQGSNNRNVTVVASPGEIQNCKYKPWMWTAKDVTVVRNSINNNHRWAHHSAKKCPIAIVVGRANGSQKDAKDHDRVLPG